MGDVGKAIGTVVSVVGAGLMIFASGGLAVAGAALMLAGSALNTYISYQEAKKAQRALENQLKQIKDNGHLVNSRSPDKYVPIVYGTCRVGGNWIWLTTTGTDNKYLKIIMTLSEGEITSVDNIYLNGVELSQTPQASLVSWGYTTGTEIQTLPSIVSSDFTDNIPYRALLCVQLTWNSEKWQTVPVITALVRGRKLYDPRTGLIDFSDNAALVALDYIRNPRYGLGIDDSRIDFNSFATAADYCDTNGFKFNGIINNENRFEALENILRHFNGILVRSAGIYKIKIQDLNNEPVVMSFNNDDIVAGSFRMDIPSIEDIVNTVKVTFLDDELNYQGNTITVEDLESVSTDPVRETELPLVGANREHAIKIANYVLKRAKINRTVTVTLSPRAQALEQGDVIKLTYEDFGINEKLFRVMSLSYNQDDTVTVSLLEEDYSLYDFTTSTVVGTYPTITLPDPYETPPSPTNLVVTEDAYQQKDGSWTTRLVVQFNEPLYGYNNYYEIWVQEDTGAKVHIANIDADSPGSLIEYYYEQTKEGTNYTFYVKTVNIFGIKSLEISDSIVATGKVVVPDDVTFDASKSYFRSTIHLEWTPSSEIKDLAYYEIRTDTNFGNSTNLIARTNELYLDLDGAAFPQTTLTFYIKARDTSGNWSTNYGSITLTNPIPADVSFISTACYFTSDIHLEWNPASPIDDLDYYEIRTDINWGNETGLVAQTKELSLTLDGLQWNSSRSWTFYIKAKDTLGNWSTNYGSITVENAIPDTPTVTLENNFETIIVKWEPVSGGDIVGYEVDVNGTIYNVGLSSSYSFIGTAGTSYTISVRAVDICGPGNWSASGSITAEDLQVTSLPEGYNLVQDWQFVNWPDSWYKYGDISRINITDGIAGIYAIQNTAGVFAYIHTPHDEQHLIPVDTNKSYIAECYFRKISGTIGDAFVRIDFLDSSYTYLGDKRAIVSATSSGWQLARAVVQPGDYPAGTKWLRIVCLVNWDAGVGDSQWQIQAPKLREVIEAAWIRDAAITETKIADAAITNAKIADAAVTDAKISGVIQSNFLAPDGNPAWKIDKDGTAEFHGITIYDPYGNPVLTTDGVLWDKVYGTTKPEDNATVGAKAGVNLQSSTGSVLNDSDVITSQGTAADTSKVAGLSSSGVVASLGDCLALNPTFELGNYGWNSPPGYSIIQDSSLAKRGNWLATFTGDTAALRNEYIFPVKPGDVIKVEGWVKTTSDANGYCGWRVSLLDSSLVEVAIREATQAAPFTDWVFMSREFVVPTGVEYARLEAVCYNRTTGTIYFDEGRIYYYPKITPTNADTFVDYGAINNQHIADSAVDGNKIASGAVSTVHIADASITNAKIADLAVDTAKIADVAITNAKIADLAVDNAKIASGAVGTVNIQDLAVTQLHIFEAGTISITPFTYVECGNLQFTLNSTVAPNILLIFSFSEIGTNMNFEYTISDYIPRVMSYFKIEYTETDTITYTSDTYFLYCDKPAQTLLPYPEEYYVKIVGGFPSPCIMWVKQLPTIQMGTTINCYNYVKVDFDASPLVACDVSFAAFLSYK